MAFSYSSSKVNKSQDVVIVHRDQSRDSVLFIQADTNGATFDVVTGYSINDIEQGGGVTTTHTIEQKGTFLKLDIPNGTDATRIVTLVNIKSGLIFVECFSPYMFQAFTRESIG